MPIAVILRTAAGRVLRALDDPAGGTFDAAGNFDRLLPLVSGFPIPPPTSYRLFQKVDPDGDTVFDHSQMADLLDDIDTAQQLDLRPIERRGLDRLRVMAERCQDSDDLRICFIGD